MDIYIPTLISQPISQRASGSRYKVLDTGTGGWAWACDRQRVVGMGM